jgi:hypothetical protein
MAYSTLVDLSTDRPALALSERLVTALIAEVEPRNTGEVIALLSEWKRDTPEKVGVMQ